MSSAPSHSVKASSSSACSIASIGEPAAIRPISLTPVGRRGGGRVVEELDRPRHVRLAVDQALLLERLEVAHHPVGALDLELVADLADRRAVAPPLDLAADELVDLALARGQGFEVGHGQDLRRWRGSILRPSVGAGSRRGRSDGLAIGWTPHDGRSPSDPLTANVHRSPTYARTFSENSAPAPASAPRQALRPRRPGLTSARAPTGPSDAMPESSRPDRPNPGDPRPSRRRRVPVRRDAGPAGRAGCHVTIATMTPGDCGSVDRDAEAIAAIRRRRGRRPRPT